jgi:hypothetical protein
MPCTSRRAAASWVRPSPSVLGRDRKGNHFGPTQVAGLRFRSNRVAAVRGRSWTRHTRGDAWNRSILTLPRSSRTAGACRSSRRTVPDGPGRRQKAFRWRFLDTPRLPLGRYSSPAHIAGIQGRSTMPRIPEQALREVEQALEQYKREVKAGPLARHSKTTYARNAIRTGVGSWLVSSSKSEQWAAASGDKCG